MYIYKIDSTDHVEIKSTLRIIYFPAVHNHKQKYKDSGIIANKTKMHLG